MHLPSLIRGKQINTLYQQTGGFEPPEENDYSSSLPPSASIQEHAQPRLQPLLVAPNLAMLMDFLKIHVK